MAAGRCVEGRPGRDRARAPRLRQPRAARTHRGGAEVAATCPCVVATSSLELGIDMGAVDLVIQVESPPSVASGLQRIGRAGHQVGAVSRGVMFPKHRGDLVPTAVVAERMQERRRSRRSACRATRSTCSPSRSSRWSRWSRGRSTTSLALVRRTAPFAVAARERAATPCSTCSPGATPVTSSPSCGPASSGTASPARSPAGPARSASP